LKTKKLRVLIVDDHLTWRKTLWLVLASLPELEVVGEAVDGETALSVCQVARPDLVLLDINMPGMNGFETARALLSKHPKLWIIGVSAEVNQESQKLAQEAGFRAVVSKANLLDYLTPTSLNSLAV
jgi:two-component system secretion response regulator SsrB